LVQANVNEKHLEESTDLLLNMVEDEVKLLDGNYSKVAIGGYYHGGTVALAAL